MHIFLVGAEMLLCMPMEIIIEGPNLKADISKFLLVGIIT